MAHSYTPGLTVADRMVVRRRRLLPLPGSVLVKMGEILAENKPLIKWFKTEIRSPVAGTIESLSEVTGQVLLREPPRVLNLLAYIDGTVVETIPRQGVVVEAHCSLVQGIFGIGGEVWGELLVAVATPDEPLEPGHLIPEMKGKIVVG